MRILINLFLFLLVAGTFAWWLRPYWQRWVRMYQTARNALKFVRQVRDGKTDFSSQQNRQSTSQQAKTVDVMPKMTVKVGCPVCREMLSEAQLEAMRASQLRCPAMIQGSTNCPYYGRSLN